MPSPQITMTDAQAIGVADFLLRHAGNDDGVMIEACSAGDHIIVNTGHASAVVDEFGETAEG